MTLIMAYTILVSVTLAASAVVTEMLLRRRQLPTRWTWLSAMALVVVATGYALFVPGPVRETPSPYLVATGIPMEKESADPPLEALPRPVVVDADVVLGWSWLAASAALLSLLMVGRVRVDREKRRARLGNMQGHKVLLTHDLGPAVAGVREPVVFVPRWVTALDDGSQRLLLAHELEHVRARDTAVLTAGALLIALVPWNPVGWWLVRRLRLAVEQDCDARVLARHPGVRRYADLLLTAASRHGLAVRLLAAHFGEHTTDLLRRIEAMTSVPKLSWRKLGGATFIAGVLIAVACETPRPEPVAPLSPAGGPAASEGVSEETVKPVLLSGSKTPKYPELLRQAGVEGEVLVSFDVDEDGQPDVATIKVIQSTHELFSVAVREALPDMRFRPAERDGRKVKLTVQEPFTFTLVGAKSPQERRMWPKDALQETVVTGVRGNARPALTLRGATSSRANGSPLIIVDGVVMKGVLKDIDPQTIESIEVVKGAAASKMYGPRAEHGVVQIITKSRRRVP